MRMPSVSDRRRPTGRRLRRWMALLWRSGVAGQDEVGCALGGLGIEADDGLGGGGGRGREGGVLKERRSHAADSRWLFEVPPEGVLARQQHKRRWLTAQASSGDAGAGGRRRPIASAAGIAQYPGRRRTAMKRGGARTRTWTVTPTKAEWELAEAVRRAVGGKLGVSRAEFVRRMVEENPNGRRSAILPLEPPLKVLRRSTVVSSTPAVSIAAAGHPLPVGSYPPISCLKRSCGPNW